MSPQCRAAVSLRWPSGQSAKVELQDFNLKRARGPDDRREIGVGRAAGEGWRGRFAASRGGGGAAVADGERRRGADWRRGATSAAASAPPGAMATAIALSTLAW